MSMSLPLPLKNGNVWTDGRRNERKWPNNGNGTKEKSGPHLRSQEMLEQPDESERGYWFVSPSNITSIFTALEWGSGHSSTWQFNFHVALPWATYEHPRLTYALASRQGAAKILGLAARISFVIMRMLLWLPLQRQQLYGSRYSFYFLFG